MPTKYDNDDLDSMSLDELIDLQEVVSYKIREQIEAQDENTVDLQDRIETLEAELAAAQPVREVIHV